MSETTTTAGVRVINLTVEAELQQAQQVAAAAYVFTARGRLLGAAPLGEKGAAQIQLAALSDPQEVLVLVGPQLRETDQKPSLDELRRQGAAEQMLRVEAQSESARASFTITPEIWRCWLHGLYTVRGRVVKRLGSTDLPIVGATVEIYEVDPIHIIIPRLPDLVIEDIRHILIDPRPPVEVSIPRTPVVQPIPLPDQAPFAMPMQATASAAISAVPAALEFVARNANTFQLRQQLLLHPEIIRLLLCRLHPMFVTKQLVAQATTDRCGEFRALASQGCDSDTPDLYFIVKQRVFPLLPPIAIYAPLPVSCYTYWDYAGAEVTLLVTNPLAIASPPCTGTPIPEFGVVVEALGNTPVTSIFGASDAEPAPVTAANRGLTHAGQPWGGTLRLRLDFDPALRSHGVRYYRVGYRRGFSGSFTDLELPIHRFYRTYGGADPVDTLYPLGPQTVGATQHLYEIPPALPLPANSVWIIRDLYEATIHAKMPTESIAPGIAHDAVGPDNAGKYQLCIEVFDTAGNQVDLVASGVQFFVPTATNPVAAAGLGLVSGNSFIMTLHIDNNPCFAEIATPVDQDGQVAGTECGVIDYARAADGSKLGSVTMSYRAAQRNGFATYSFHLYRGANDRTLPAFSGTPALPVDNAPVAPTPFSHTQPISALLGSCDVAGFSQNLSVAALATDGLSRLSGNDRSAVFAFALAPEGVA